MSKFDQRMRARLIRANEKIKKVQRALTWEFVGLRVKINTEQRGPHSRRKYKPGTEFIVYDVLVEGRDVTLWLSRVEDAAFPSFELSVWLYEAEFMAPAKSRGTK